MTYWQSPIATEYFGENRYIITNLRKKLYINEILGTSVTNAIYLYTSMYVKREIGKRSIYNLLIDAVKLKKPEYTTL